MLDHVFFDARFSHVDPTKGEIIEIAAIRTDGKGKPFKEAAYSNKILPTRPVDPDSVKHNRYNESVWANDGITLNVAKESLRGLVLNTSRYDEKYVVVVHFAERLVNCRDLFPGRAWIDTAQVGWPLAFNSIVSGRKVETLARHYGVEVSDSDTAQGNVVMIARLYWEMMRRMKTALMGENAIQEAIGGTIVDSFRKLVKI